MDWVKIYDKHLFRWSLKEIGAVVRLQLLTAKLERMPTLEEMAQEVPKTTLRAVQTRLKAPAKTLQEVLELVLEDVQAVVDRRLQGRQRNEKWRKEHKNQTNKRVSKIKTNEADKIREDKMGHTPANAGTPQAAFVNTWADLYRSEAGSPYKADREEFIIAARLLTRFGETEVLSRARILFEACKRRVWPGKSGMADFTVKKLSSQWNTLIPDLLKSKNDAAVDEFLKSLKEDDDGSDKVFGSGKVPVCGESKSA